MDGSTNAQRKDKLSSVSSATRDTSTTSTGVINFYKYGQMVLVQVDVGVSDNSTWNRIKIGSGLPPCASFGGAFPITVDSTDYASGWLEVDSGGNIYLSNRGQTHVNSVIRSVFTYITNE